MTWTGFGVQHELPDFSSTNQLILQGDFKSEWKFGIEKRWWAKKHPNKNPFRHFKEKNRKKNTLLQESSRPQCKVRRFDCFFNLYPAKHPPSPKKKSIPSQKTRRFFLSKSSAPHGHVGAHGSYTRSSHGGLFRLQRIDRPLRGASLWLAI